MVLNASWEDLDHLRPTHLGRQLLAPGCWHALAWWYPPRKKPPEHREGPVLVDFFPELQQEKIIQVISVSITVAEFPDQSFEA